MNLSKRRMLHSSDSHDLTTGNLIPKLLSYSIPLILTGVLQLSFNTADLIVVGRLAENGDQGLAAIGGTGPLINLIINMFIGLSVGTSVFTARYIGAGDRQKTHETVHTSIFLSLIGGVICFIIGFVGARQFLTWMGTLEEVIDLSTLYLRIYFVGIPATLVYNFGAAILRAAGDTTHPLIFLTISGVVNVLLNLVTVICFHRSVDGVAFASSVSQFVAAGLVIWYLCKKANGAYKLELSKLRIYPKRLWELIKIGVPAGLQGSLFSISNIIIQSAVNSFKITAVVTGSVASGSIEGFIYTAMNAFHHSALSFIGQNIGAGKPQKIGKITGTCVAMVTAVGLSMGCLATLFGEQLLKLYINTSNGENANEAIKYGMIRLTIIALSYFTCGIMDVFSGSLRGMGASLGPTLICLTGVCGLRILWIYTVFRQFHELDVLFYSYPISWVVTIIAQFIYFLVLKKKLLRQHQREQIEELCLNAST